MLRVVGGVWWSRGTPNYAFKPIAEQALRSIQTIVPQRLNAALDLRGRGVAIEFEETALMESGTDGVAVENTGFGALVVRIFSWVLIVAGFAYIGNVVATTPDRPSWVGFHLFLGLTVLAVGCRMYAQSVSNPRIARIAEHTGAMALGALAVGVLLN